jgi:hypothetical protein
MDDVDFLFRINRLKTLNYNCLDFVVFFSVGGTEKKLLCRGYTFISEELGEFAATLF